MLRTCRPCRSVVHPPEPGTIAAPLGSSHFTTTASALISDWAAISTRAVPETASVLTTRATSTTGAVGLA